MREYKNHKCIRVKIFKTKLMACEGQGLTINCTHYLKSRLWKARISELLHKKFNLHNLHEIKATKARVPIKQSFYIRISNLHNLHGIKAIKARIPIKQSFYIRISNLHNLHGIKAIKARMPIIYHLNIYQVKYQFLHRKYIVP